MGLFKSLIRLHTESKLSDQYGLGAIELYSNTLNNIDKINAENNEKQEFEANKIKVINLLNKAINETEKYLNDYYINKIEEIIEKVDNSSPNTFNTYLTKARRLLHECEYIASVNEIIGNFIDQIASIDTEKISEETKLEIEEKYLKIKQSKNKIEAKIYIKSLEDYLKNHHITITNLYELNKKLEIDD